MNHHHHHNDNEEAASPPSPPSSLTDCVIPPPSSGNYVKHDQTETNGSVGGGAGVVAPSPASASATTTTTTTTNSTATIRRGAAVVARRYTRRTPSPHRSNGVSTSFKSTSSRRVSSGGAHWPSQSSQRRTLGHPLKRVFYLKPGLFLCALVLVYFGFVVLVVTTTPPTRHSSSSTAQSILAVPRKQQNDVAAAAADHFRQELQHQAEQAIMIHHKQLNVQPLQQQPPAIDSNADPIKAPGWLDPQDLFPASPQDIAAAAPIHDEAPPHNLSPHHHPTPDRILTAHAEPVDFQTWWNTQPLPNRSDYTAKAHLLTAHTFARVSSCRQLIQQWPTDASSNDCVADADPFLPWIHDVFPSADGRHVHVVAQNRRRCDTGKHDGDVIAFRAGQAALFQHVPLKRVPNIEDNDNEPRFIVTPSHDQADPDAVATRFLCRFSTGHIVPSVFHFDYDWTAHRKRYKGTFIEGDGGIKSIHTSQLVFACPIPESLQDTVRRGLHVKNDWTTLFVDLVPIRTPPRYGKANQFFQPRYRSEQMKPDDPDHLFDPYVAWGNNTHLLPKIQDSGRWENIPICLPSLLQYEKRSNTNNDNNNADDETNWISHVPENGKDKIDEPIQVSPLEVHPQYPPPVKKHRIVSCLWASAGYRTRGERFAINDGQRRLLEWITYHQDVLGFDHVYLYDNSGAFTNETSLKPVADLFPNTVTYIGWPSQICNNRPNNVDSPGERSSQYAAESSCRLRFGPHADWIGQFDVDEYLVPMGNYHSIHELLDTWEKEDTRIVSFASWRAWPRWSQIGPIVPIYDKHMCWDKHPCFELTVPLSHTILQTYNCDRQLPGQKQSKMPAEKQIYRPDYVTQHFVHYSAVTTLSEQNSTEWQAQGLRYKPRAFPDPRQRFAKETTEALMIHTKAVARQDTSNWEEICHVDNLKKPKERRGLCRLGVPWPLPWPQDPETAPVKGTPEGWAYNCFVNQKAEHELIPKLQKALEARAPGLGPQTFD